MKKSSLVIVSLFLLVVFLPFVEVDSVVVQIMDVINPESHGSFPFSIIDEVFTGYSIITGLIPDTSYVYYYWWYIDTVEVKAGSGGSTASGAGVLQLNFHFDYTVDVSGYSVGEHNVKLKIDIYNVILIVSDDHTHIWYRSADPNNDPVIMITAPATDYEVHNRTSVGNDFLVEWSVNDDDGTIVAMEIKFDGVSNKTWENPAELPATHSRVITCLTDKEYTILITCEDDDSATDSETIHITVITGSTGTILMLKPDGTCHSQPIDFTAQSDDLDGLNNLSVMTDQANFWTINNHDNGTQFGADLRVFSDNSDAWGEDAGGDLWKRDASVFYLNDSVVGSHGQIYILPEDEITFTDYDAWSVKLKGRIPTIDLDSFTLMVAGNLNGTNDYWFKMFVVVGGSIAAGLSTSGGSKFEMITGYWSEASYYTVGDWITMEMVFDLENSTVKYYFDDVLKKSSSAWFDDVYNGTYTKRCNVANHNAAGKVENLEVDDFQLRVNNDNEVLQWIYVSSDEVTQIDNWDIPAANWTDFYEGDFDLVFALGDDVGNIVTYTRIYTKDTTAPTITITLPNNESEWFVSEVPSLNYQLDWGGNDGDDTNELLFELNYNATNNVVVSWVVSEPLPDRFPACDRKIVDSFGSYYCRLRAIDSAENVAFSEIVYFEVFNERMISIICTSQYNSASLDVSRYLRFVVDGARSSYEDIVVKTDEFEFVIEDVFGNELYNNPRENYASTKAYSLSLRGITFTNSLNRLAEYLIVQDDGNEDLGGFIASGGSKVVYLFDGTYDVVLAAVNNKISDGHYYLKTDRTITTSSGATSFILNCDTMQIGSGVGGSTVAERLDKIVVYFGLALLFVLLLVVVKGNVRNTSRFIKAKVTRGTWQSVEDERIDKSVYRNKMSRRREKEEERKKKEEKRVSGMPVRNPSTNEEYRKRFG